MPEDQPTKPRRNPATAPVPEPGEFLLYQTEDGQCRVEVRINEQTVWLSLAQMTDLFGRDKSVISRHIANIFAQGELAAQAVVADFATTASDGKTCQVSYYNLDVIISVGYRVKSLRGTQFRIWATQRLRKLLEACGGSGILPLQSAAQGQGHADLDDWLRNEFFEQHCKMFHDRPFVWHIWDGRKRDGFHAIVNYHKLADGKQGRMLLEKPTYTYLGEWVSRQQDGVRLNIRPFMAVVLPKEKKGAGALRWKAKTKWEKDRGREPERKKTQYPWFWGWNEPTVDFMGGQEFQRERFNACH